MSEAANSTPRTRLLKVTEAAEQLRVTRGQVYNLIRADLLRSIRLPTHTGGEDGAIRIEQSELDAFIERAAANSP